MISDSLLPQFSSSISPTGSLDIEFFMLLNQSFSLSDIYTMLRGVPEWSWSLDQIDLSV
jgi:hypothetical protein